MSRYKCFCDACVSAVVVTEVCDDAARLTLWADGTLTNGEGRVLAPRRRDREAGMLAARAVVYGCAQHPLAAVTDLESRAYAVAKTHPGLAPARVYAIAVGSYAAVSL